MKDNLSILAKKKKHKYIRIYDRYVTYNDLPRLNLVKLSFSCIYIGTENVMTTLSVFISVLTSIR
jgi:hypothetical protein